MEISAKETLLPEDGDLQKAKELLEPLPHLLAAFVYRNKNQHRRSRWWAELGILRRNLSRLLSEICATFQAADEVMKERERRDLRLRLKGQKDGQKKWEEAEARFNDVKTKEREARKRVGKRATWMIGLAGLESLVLAADNQYAPMGLMLLGVLARVYSALDGLCASPSHQEKDLPTRFKEVVGSGDMMPVPVGVSDLVGHLGPGSVGVDLGVAISMNEDVGVAVSRDELEQLPIPNTAGKVRTKRPGWSPKLGRAETPATNSTKAEEMEWQGVSSLDGPALLADPEGGKGKRRKRDSDNELGSLFASLGKPATKATRKKQKPKPETNDGKLGDISRTRKATHDRAKPRDKARELGLESPLSSLEEGKQKTRVGGRESKEKKSKKRGKADLDDIFSSLI